MLSELAKGENRKSGSVTLSEILAMGVLLPECERIVW